MKRFEKLSAITLQATNSLVGAFRLVRLLISRLSPGRSFCTSNISSPTIWLAFLLRTYLTLLKLTGAVSGDFLGDEDCLLLNIYSPREAFLSDDLAPVLVWIYGGGFLTGSARFS